MRACAFACKWGAPAPGLERPARLSCAGPGGVPGRTPAAMTGVAGIRLVVLDFDLTLTVRAPVLNEVHPILDVSLMLCAHVRPLVVFLMMCTQTQPEHSHPHDLDATVLGEQILNTTGVQSRRRSQGSKRIAESTDERKCMILNTSENTRSAL